MTVHTFSKGIDFEAGLTAKEASDALDGCRIFDRARDAMFTLLTQSKRQMLASLREEVDSAMSLSITVDMMADYQQRLELLHGMVVNVQSRLAIVGRELCGEVHP